MTRIKTSILPAAMFAGLAVALLSSAASAKDIKSKTVNCSIPAQTLANALSSTSSDTVDEIVFSGTCIEDLTITKDDVTLIGADGTAEIQGQIDIDGARRVSLRDFILTTAGDLGVVAFGGAAIKIDNVDISGAADNNIFIRRNASAEVRNSTIDAATVTNINVVNGGGLLIRDSSIENSGDTGINVSNGSFARIINTSVTDSVGSSVFVNTGSIARIHDANLNTGLGVQEGGHVRIQNSTLSDGNDVALAVGRGGTARLFGGGSVLTSGGSEVIRVVSHSMLEQSGGGTIRSLEISESKRTATPESMMPTSLGTSK